MTSFTWPPAPRLRFMVDWYSGSGDVPPGTDVDIVVRWYDSTAGKYRDIGRNNQRAGGGQYGGDNVALGINYEEVIWPATAAAAIPDGTDFDVCVIWHATTELLYVNYHIELDGVLQTGATYVWLDTYSDPPTEACAPGVAGYLGSYRYFAPAWLESSGSASVASLAPSTAAGVASAQRDTATDQPQLSEQPLAVSSDTAAVGPQQPTGDAATTDESTAVAAGAAGPAPAPQAASSGTSRVVLPLVIVGCVVGVVVIGAAVVVWRRKSLAHSDGRVMPI
ncbi:hypothetical protein HXX76_002024 [Chlamydomonas incerta]|uniref:Uncharacterized protein n=1 Tax=Chlamydomonas incerta TaxID=51695 RepID=A0A836B039_CHLIN|nr:hypothetical protein HXX76_002024 [Chlamydomonas incerta]|eukprot:KAG2443676.1 hypothetical protein HXX76_002024 [Chlamydomonas incerta]